MAPTGRYLEDPVLRRTTSERVGHQGPADYTSRIDLFLQQAVEARSADRVALQAQLKALDSERSDQDVSTWRRLEAQPGYDPDEAPDHLIRAVLEYAVEFWSPGSPLLTPPAFSAEGDNTPGAKWLKDILDAHGT